MKVPARQSRIWGWISTDMPMQLKPTRRSRIADCRLVEYDQQPIAALTQKQPFPNQIGVTSSVWVLASVCGGVAAEAALIGCMENAATANKAAVAACRMPLLPILHACIMHYQAWKLHLWTVHIAIGVWQGAGG